jgi:hypothetical protein
MIISHHYRYVFVELPRTGSTAISQELRTNYKGVSILRKHSTYGEFLKTASEDEKRYFVFSCVRNPLDDAVSRYFKLKTDHRHRYTDPVKLKKRWTLVERFETWLYRYIQNSDVDFPTFFLLFYRLPYNNWTSLMHKKFDYVLRFEMLQEDFSRVLQMLGIEQVRPLPVANKTGARSQAYHTYYTPPAIRRAKWVFGPYMKQWGYEFPPEWGDVTVWWLNQFVFDVANQFRFFYWRHLRYRI